MQTEPVYRTVYTRWARAPASQSCFGKHGCKRPVDKRAKQTVVHTRFSSHSFTQRKSRHPLLWQAARVVRGSSYLQSVCRAGHPRVIHFTKRLLRGSSAGHRGSCAGHPIYKGFTVRVIRSPRLAFKNLKGLRCGVQGPPGARPALQRHRVWNLTL